MEISGIEDEYHQALKLGRDVLLYVKKAAPRRHERLASLIEDARLSVTTYSYDNEADLEDQIHADITSVVSQAFIDRFPQRGDRLIDPSAILGGIIPAGTIPVRRVRLERALDSAIQQQQVCWVTGAAGSGKTVLLAQWALKRRSPYINARGLSLRHLIRSIVTALSSDKAAPDVPATLDGAVEVLRSVWTDEARWPFVIDDPADPDELAILLEELNEESLRARVLIGARTGSEPDSAVTVALPGLDSEEVTGVIRQLPIAIRDRVSAATSSTRDVFPLDIRRAVAAASVTPQHSIFDKVADSGLDAVTRELLALIVASREPLELEDLRQLLSPEGDNPVVIDSRLSSISYLVIDDGLGYRPVIASDLRALLAGRPSLNKFVSLRLAQFFARNKRHMAAFELYRQFDPAKALRAAYRAVPRAVVEGRLGHTIPPLEFIADFKRKNGERFDLAFVLLSLSQAYESIGNTTTSDAALAEAEKTATQVDDQTLLQMIQDQRLISRVRRELRPADLTALRVLRARYKAEGRILDSARLAAEEGAILILVGDHEGSISVSREARSVFLEVGDQHGVHIATRNLIASLNMVDGGQIEAEQLLRDLRGGSRRLGHLRERAWMCNILTRRYRIDGRIDDAIAAAKEAIEIGGKLSEPYVVALNRIGLGNALRQKGDLAAALESFKQCGREAQAIKRNEMDGLASRLTADVLVQMADAAAPYQRPQLFSEAEIT